MLKYRLLESEVWFRFY